MVVELKELEDKATEVFRLNSHRRRIYDGAPAKAKEYYRLMFALSIAAMVSNGGQVDMARLGADEERDRIYQTMDDESWDYVLANAEHAEGLGLYIARKHMQGKPNVKYGDWLQK